MLPPPPLTAARAAFPAALQLVLSAIALLLSLLLALIESRLSPRPPRLLADGEASAPSRAALRAASRRHLPLSTDPLFDQPPDPAVHPLAALPAAAPGGGAATLGAASPPSRSSPPSPPPRRARVCVAAARIALAVVLLASLVLPLRDAVRFLVARPPEALASPEVNRFAHALMRRALLLHAADAPSAAPLVAHSARLGLGPHADAPDGPDRARLRWGSLIFLVALVVAAGAMAAVAAELLPVKRAVAVILFVEVGVWVIFALAASLVHPTRLPVDAAPLQNHWMDRVYSQYPGRINVTRFIGNWYVVTTADDSGSVRLTGKSLERAFCRQFVDAMPKTGAEVIEQESDEESGEEDEGGEDDDDDDQDASGDLPTGGEGPGDGEGDEDTEAGTTAPSTTSAGRPTQSTDSVDSGDEPSNDDDDAEEDEEEEDEEDEEEEDPPPSAPSTSAPSSDSRPTQAIRVVLRQPAGMGLGAEDDAEKQGGFDPDAVAIESISTAQAAEFLLAYLIGKPVGIDYFRILFYMALGAAIAGPVAAGQMCRSWLLYPFVALWGAVWFLIALLATPSTLRVLFVPRGGPRSYTICGVTYRILVADSATMLVARLDVSIFVLVVLVALVQAVRWMRHAQRSATEDEEKEVKLVNYEEVYSDSGSLRW